MIIKRVIYKCLLCKKEINEVYYDKLDSTNKNFIYKFCVSNGLNRKGIGDKWQRMTTSINILK